MYEGEKTMLHALGEQKTPKSTGSTTCGRLSARSVDMGEHRITHGERKVERNARTGRSSSGMRSMRGTAVMDENVEAEAPPGASKCVWRTAVSAEAVTVAVAAAAQVQFESRAVQLQRQFDRQSQVLCRLRC